MWEEVLSISFIILKTVNQGGIFNLLLLLLFCNNIIKIGEIFESTNKVS
jgi:hypothetical protein